MKKIIMAFIMLFSSLSFASQDTIKIITMSGTGSMSDTVARFISPIIEKQSGKNVLVSNMPGAAGAIAARALISGNEGNLLMLCNSNVAINETLPTNEIDYRGKIEPIYGLAKAPLILYANAASGIKTLDDVKKFKQKNGVIFAGSTGLNNIVIKDLSDALDTDITIVGYKNASEMVTNAMGNFIHIFAAAAGSTAAEGAVANGNIVPIAVLNTMRSKGYPQLKTIKEQGYRNITTFDWLALCTKKDYTEEQKKYLTDVITGMMKTEDIKKYEEMVGNPSLWFANRDAIMKEWLTDYETAKKFNK